jgi:hypothetical protein
MLNEYIIEIKTEKNKAKIRLQYKNEKLFKIIFESGKLSKQAYKSITDLIPQMQVDLLPLILESKYEGVFWTQIQKEYSLHLKMLDVFTKWYEGYTNIKPRITASEVVALKQIKTHLLSVYSTDVDVLKVWDSIFVKWNDLLPFYQCQTELRHINQNLNIILRQIGEFQQAISLDDKFENILKS